MDSEGILSVLCLFKALVEKEYKPAFEAATQAVKDKKFFEDEFPSNRENTEFLRSLLVQKGFINK